jgi:hypothetical protein
MAGTRLRLACRFSSAGTLFHQRALARDGGNMANLIVLGTIIYVSYYFMRITAYCVLWLIGALSFKQGDGSPLPPLTSEDDIAQRGLLNCFRGFTE